MKLIKLFIIFTVISNPFTAVSRTEGGSETVHVISRGSDAAAASAASAAGAAVADYHEIDIPDVREADENLRKDSVVRALRRGADDTTLDVDRPLSEVFMSSGEKSDVRLSVSTGAFVNGENKIFYDKKRQPRKGATPLPFSIISKKSAGRPYPESRVPNYSESLNAVDYLNNKMYTPRELCLKSNRDAITAGEPARCISLMNDLLVKINTGFDRLSDHAEIHKIFYDYQVVANTCERVFDKNDCDMKNFGQPVYQRIQLLNKNFQSLIWAYNVYLKVSRTDGMGLEFLGLDASFGAAASAPAPSAPPAAY
tara:strand:- start:24196 stop:25128 length:933 start_codon:yes stop_codon:yes gene_type:complete